MTEEQLQVFINGVNNYFQQISKNEITVGTPYLVENTHPAAKDYTGIIGISGISEGIVYFTAPKDLLERMLVMLGERDLSEANMIDLVGEVANTISGNARSEFGENFDISVPFVIKGAPDEITLPRKDRSYVIPVEWCERKASIVVALRKKMG